MAHLRRLAAVYLGVLLLGGCGGGAGAPAPDEPPAAAAPTTPVQDDGMITARSLLDAAMAVAQQWQADAQLAGVSTGLAEGPSNNFWFYDFQSPAQGSCTRVRALANGRVENVGTGESCGLARPVSVGFVDSPTAFEAARAAGFEPGDSVQFGLRFQRDEALAAPRECWVLWSDLDGDDDKGIIRGWCVDPYSGAFVTRLSGYGRIEPLN